MNPQQLRPDSFAGYPPLAQALATRYIDLLRALPLSFAPLLLREVIGYDWQFPAERKELDDQFTYLGGLTPEQLSQSMKPFASITVSADIGEMNWSADPVVFSEKLSAYLWATRQMDGFRKGSISYVHDMKSAAPKPKQSLARLSVILIGQQAGPSKYKLFRKLRPHGSYYSNVIAPQDGLEQAVAVVSKRAVASSDPFAHWYVDGSSSPVHLPSSFACVSYKELASTRALLIQKMVATMEPGGGGPEVLRTRLAKLQPKDVDLPDSGGDAVLSRFKLNLLTQGSGTQIFSTTFVQWTARELLRRAQPATLLARFAPRQREATIRSQNSSAVDLDPDASLIDADMGAYYTWLSAQQLSNSAQSRFLVWVENGKQALLTGPDAKPGAVDESPTHFKEILARLA